MQYQQNGTHVHWFRKVLAFFLLFFCLWFIWSNSLQSPVESARRSEAVAAFIARFLRLFVSENHSIIRYLLFNVRKIAHAVEFFVLGFVCAIFLRLLKKVNLHMVLHSVLLLLAAAVTDEGIQLYTHRGASVSDILLDFASGVCGLLIAFLLLFISNAVFVRADH